jgi:hypothetical protein
MEEEEPFDVGHQACLDGVFDHANPFPSDRRKPRNGQKVGLRAQAPLAHRR